MRGLSARALLQGIVLLVAVASVLLQSPTVAAQGRARQISVIVDTSGSMPQTNDPYRYAWQLSKILADLQDPARDALSVVRMPKAETCQDGPDPTLIRRLSDHPSDFEAVLDQHLADNSGTLLYKSARTARDDLGTDLSRNRLLLIIADAQDIRGCPDGFYRELKQIKDSGSMVAAITLRQPSLLPSTGRAFYDHPGHFDRIEDATSATEMIHALALVYQDFLGSKSVQDGELSPGRKITVEISPYVREAWLVVAADGALPRISEASGNPGRRLIDLDHRGGGRTLGAKDGKAREYRIVRIEKPEAGSWTFEAPGMGDEAGWMLLQDFAITARLRSSVTVPKGRDVPLEVELIDDEGKIVSDPDILKELEVTTTVGGRTVTLKDDGTGGDKKAGDGILTTTVRHDQPGKQAVPIRIVTPRSDETIFVEQDVVSGSFFLNMDLPPRFLLGEQYTLAVALVDDGQGSPARPDRVIYETDTTVVLLDNGQGADRVAGDGEYTGQWTPSVQGPLLVKARAEGGDRMAPAESHTEVVGAVRFGVLPPVELGSLDSHEESVQTDKSQLDLRSTQVKGRVPVKITTSIPEDAARLEIMLDGAWEPLDADGATIELVDGAVQPLQVRASVGECPEGLGSGDAPTLVLEADGWDFDAQNQLVLQPARAEVEVALTVAEDSLLWCLRHVIAAAITAVLVGIMVFGYWWASAFRKTWWVVFVETDDPDEELTRQRIRSIRGSGKKPFIDARIHVTRGFKLQRSGGGAIAQLHAQDGGCRVLPGKGARLQRLNSDDEWEDIGSDGRRLVLGEHYREADGSFLFKVVARG